MGGSRDGHSKRAQGSRATFMTRFPPFKSGNQRQSDSQQAHRPSTLRLPPFFTWERKLEEA